MTVQLGEALIWNEPEGPLGNIGSYIVFFSIWLQPILATGILMNYGVSTPILYAFAALLLIYVVSTLEPIKKLAANKYKPKLCDGKDTSHIAIHDNGTHGTFYGIIIATFLIIIFPQFPYISGFLAITYLISQTFYKDTIGSMWCWFSVASPAVFYLTRNLPVLTSWSQIAKTILK